VGTTRGGRWRERFSDRLTTTTNKRPSPGSLYRLYSPIERPACSDGSFAFSCFFLFSFRNNAFARQLTVPKRVWRADSVSSPVVRENNDAPYRQQTERRARFNSFVLGDEPSLWRGGEGAIIMFRRNETRVGRN